MRLLIAVDLNDEDLVEAYQLPADVIGAGSEWDDILNSLDARLEEAGYFGRYNSPVRGHLVAAGDFSGNALRNLIDAAQVGLEGAPDAGAMSEGEANHVWASLTTFEQHAQAQEAI